MSMLPYTVTPGRDHGNRRDDQLSLCRTYWRRCSMGEPPTPPRIETDWRVPLRFFAWLFAMFLFSGGFVLVTLGSPKAEKYVGDRPWLIPVFAGVAFLCVAAAVAPFFFGIRCRGCGRWLRRMAGGTDLNTGTAPRRFHCVACNVIGHTGLVSGPGSSDSRVGE